MAGTAAPPHRLALIDVLRGVAILAMVVFHIAWDLYFFGFSGIDVSTDPLWFAFQKAILSSFLLLAGASLVLGHGARIRWFSFWRRFAFLFAAALLTTAGTYWMFPEYFVFFGVLHAIALFSLIGLALLRLPGWGLLAVALGLIGAAFTFTDPAFTSRELAWIGFWPVSPYTSDIVPIFPWLGVFVLGMALMRLGQGAPAVMAILARPLPHPVWRGLGLMGRWSLLIYLVHQPLLIGAFNLTLMLQPQPALQPDIPNDRVSFLSDCQLTCTAGGTELAICLRYCDCALEQVIENDMWDMLSRPERSEDENIAIAAMGRLCSAMAGVTTGATTGAAYNAAPQSVPEPGAIPAP